MVVMALFHYVTGLYEPENELVAQLREGDPGGALGVGLLYYPVRAVMQAVGVAYVLIGLMRVLGADVAAPFKRPLASPSIHEWWRRWNIHFRDFLVDIFFYPLMIKWRKRNPYATIVVGCASVFLVGSTVFHWIGKYYFEVNSHENVYWSISAENTLMFVAVTIGLCLEKRRLTRLASRSSVGPPRLGDQAVPVARWAGYKLTRAAAVGGTWAFLLLTVVFAGYGASYAVYHRPLEPVEARLAEAAALAEQGDVDRAARHIWPGDLTTLERHARKRPREPLRRLELAWGYAVPGPGQNLEVSSAAPADRPPVRRRG